MSTEERVAVLEKRVAELEERTAGLVRFGPIPSLSPGMLPPLNFNIDWAEFQKKHVLCPKCFCSQDLPKGVQVCPCSCHPANQVTL